MMYMYPGLNSFEENSFVQAQGFAFHQFRKQNWNLYNQLMDPFILESNNTLFNAFVPSDHHYQNLAFNAFNAKNGSNHIYSKYTIPSITSIISQHVTTNNFNTMNFLPLSNTNNMSKSSLDFNYNENTNLLTQSSQSRPPQSSIGLDFNYNENTNLLTQSQSCPPQSSIGLDFNYNENTNLIQPHLSYFTPPDKDTTISLQDILDGMKVVQEISDDLSTYNSNTIDSNLLQDITNNLVTDLVDENSIDWLIQDDWKETSKQDETYESKGKSPEKNQDEIFYQGILGDLIEEHMKETKKVVHNEILCQEILTDSPSLEYQDFKMIQTDLALITTEDNNTTTEDSNLTTKDSNLASMTKEDSNLTSMTKEDNNFSSIVSMMTEDNNLSSISSIITEVSISSTQSQDIIIKQEEISQTESLLSSISSNMFMPREINMITNSTNLTNLNQKTFKCNEIGCSKEYNCYAKLKSHKITTHTNDRPFMCNVFGCNKKFKRSGELIKHQLDHITLS